MTNYEKIFLSPHSHIDITWWDKPEVCQKRLLEIIDRVIYLSEKYPHFRFSLETTSPLHFYLQDFPQKKDIIKKLIENNNLEISGLYVSAISDILLDEGIIRNLYLGKKYLLDTLNYDVDFVKEEDVPGHSWQLPQILKSAGIKYLKISRGPQGIFNWCAKNDDKILTCLINYGQIAQKRQKNVESIIQSIKKFLETSYNLHQIKYPYILLPVGDDMEVPEEKLTQVIDIWNREFKSPEIIFGNFHEFMKEIEHFEHKTLKGDIPNIWSGIATMEEMVVSDLLEGERILKPAEIFSTLSYILGNNYPQDEISECYRKSLLVSDHNWGARDKDHFGEEGDKYKWNLAQEVKHLSQKVLYNSLKNICAKISFKEEGTPVVVFNSGNFKRDDIVEIELRSSPLLMGGAGHPSEGWVGEGGKEGTTSYYILKDSVGEALPYQFEDNKMVFVARDVPPLGYKTYYLHKSGENNPPTHPSDGYPAPFNKGVRGGGFTDKNKIENKFYKVEIASSGIKKLYFKDIKKDFSKSVNLITSMDKDLIIDLLKPKLPRFILKFILPFIQKIAAVILRLKFTTGELWATTGRLKPAPEGFYEKEVVEGVGETFEIGKEIFKSSKYKDEIYKGKDGPVRKSIISQSKFIDESKKQTEIVLYDEISRIDYNISINWCGREKTIVSLALPFNIKDAETFIDIPFCLYKLGEEVSGFWDDPENVLGFKARGIQDFIDISNKEYGITLSSSWPCFDFTFFPNCNLMYSDNFSAFFFGDFYLKRGEHKFKFSLCPHKKNAIESRVWKYGKNLNFPLIGYLPEKKNVSNLLPDSFSFVEISDENIIVSCIKKEENGNNLIIRFYEIEGRESEILIKFNLEILSIWLCDVLENEKGKLKVVDNAVNPVRDPVLIHMLLGKTFSNGVKIKVKPYTIYTIKVETMKIF